MLVGATAVCFGVRDLMTAKASQSWPVERGVITSSDVARIRTSHSTSSRYPKVTYHYEVGGVIYKGDRIRTSSIGSRDPIVVEAAAWRYRLNQAVDVSYDPADPAASLLETGIAASDWFLFGFGVAFLVFPAISILVFLRMRRRNAKAADASTGGLPAP